MARKKSQTATPDGVKDFRHTDARRKNNPPAGIAPTYEVRERQATPYAYDPHLDPQLVWAGKAEHTSFQVDLVSLHVHERISTQAMLKAMRRPEPVQLSLFGETPLPADQQIEFYKHDVNWANRLILGDSLLVMNSLLVKEGMAGKVQMIYVDPPYGIKYASNFQPRTDRRDVKDQDADLTREPEQIKAYRDTWKLGIHSYLTYLRDRLLLARELLSESGSIFVQIGHENVHLVRNLLDEVFGGDNYCAVISFTKTSGLTRDLVSRVNDFLLWYAKDIGKAKIRKLYQEKMLGAEGSQEYFNVELPDGETRRITLEEQDDPSRLPSGTRVFAYDSIVSGGTEAIEKQVLRLEYEGRVYTLICGPNRNWKAGYGGTKVLWAAGRLARREGLRIYKRYFTDFPYTPLTTLWTDTRGETEMSYVVQTSRRIPERCILLTTDPGDLVLDPTSGSGTTVYCAEKWGRRWITCDTSRVALAIARQRLLTARFDYYELREPERGPAGGFIYQTVPHVTLESIAHNTEIDGIAARYQPQIEEALAELNRALGKEWQEWEVPRDMGADGHSSWPEEAREFHDRFWSLKRRKRQEIDASIQRNAPQETLYDRPSVKRGVVRVSGPFTVEAIPVPAVEDPTQAPIPQFEEQEARARVSDRGGNYLADMVGLLQQQKSVLFPGGKRMELRNLRALNLGYLHAEAETEQNGKTPRVAISFGPQHGPVTAFQVQEAIPTARLNGYQVLLFAGFSFDPEAHALLQKAPVAGLQVHFANVAPDVLVGDLLKTTRASQIFTVFGQPDVALTPVPSPASGRGELYAVELRGVDVYDPLTGEVHSTRGKDVAAWFLDTDYDGRTFHICQAFFPGDEKAWDKLQRALKAQIDPEAFEQMRGTVSFPFEAGEHKRVAVKVIDFRGNEVVRVVALERSTYERARRHES